MEAIDICAVKPTRPVLRDFADGSAARSKYPRHGWATNSQGIRLIWFPILSLIRTPEKVRAEKGVGRAPALCVNHATEVWDDLCQLIIILREIKSLERAIVSEKVLDIEHQQPIARELELLPIYIEAALGQLRRFADRLVCGVAPFLFTDYAPGPNEFIDLRKDLLNEEKIGNAQPLCDIKLLRAAFDKHSGWFDILARPRRRASHRVSSATSGCIQGLKNQCDDENVFDVGLRNALEHRGALVGVAVQQVNDEHPRVVVSLGERSIGKSPWKNNLLSTLTYIVRDICSMCCCIHDSVGINGVYDPSQCIVALGNDEDVTGFWPEI